VSFSGIYVNTSGSGPGAVIETLTGNSGGAVTPTAGNVNIVGSGTINVVGNPGTSTLTISNTGTTTINYTNVATTPYVVLPTDDYLSVDCSGGPITVELPNSTTTGRVIIIKDRTGNAFTNNISITTVGGAVTIDGVTTAVQNTNRFALQVIFNSANYEVF